MKKYQCPSCNKIITNLELLKELESGNGMCDCQFKENKCYIQYKEIKNGRKRKN